jgi:hypothetical protein
MGVFLILQYLYSLLLLSTLEAFKIQNRENLWIEGVVNARLVLSPTQKAYS